MKVSLNSWHRKLFDFTYPFNVPKSLCPYFWLTALAAVLLVPVCLFAAPLILLRYLGGDKERYYLLSGENIILSIGLNTGIILAANVILMWFTDNKTIDQIGIVGIGITVFITAICTWAKVDNIKEKRRIASGYYHRKYAQIQAKKPNLLIEYLKAKKKKICPILEWE